MENFARVIGALDEYSIFNLMQNALDFKLQQENNLSYRFHLCRSARGKMLQVSFFDKKRSPPAFFAFKPACHERALDMRW